MDEERLRKEFNQLINLGPRRGVPQLLRTIDSVKAGLDLEYYLSLVHCLCVRGSTWTAAFERCTQHRGQCPSSFHAPLRHFLEELKAKKVKQPRLSLPEILKSHRQPKTEGHLCISTPQETGIYAEQEYLLAKLYRLSTQKLPLALTVDIQCDEVYIYGLAMLAAWCAKYAASVRIHTQSSRTQSYLHATGFRDALETPNPIDSPRYDRDNHVALTTVLRSNIEDADGIARRIVNLFHKHMVIDNDQESALHIILAELVENVYRHSQSEYPGYVLAQAHPEPRKIHFAIVDSGIGIYESFKQSDDPKVLDWIKSERNAIDKAVEKLVTSKSQKHSGYGLYVVSELAKRNGGVFRITSGAETLLIKPDRKGHPVESHITHKRWNGTEVSVMFNMDRPLPILDVYKSLGPISDVDDFFD